MADFGRFLVESDYEILLILYFIQIYCNKYTLYQQIAEYVCQLIRKCSEIEKIKNLSQKNPQRQHQQNLSVCELFLLHLCLVYFILFNSSCFIHQHLQNTFRLKSSTCILNEYRKEKENKKKTRKKNQFKKIKKSSYTVLYILVKQI